MFAILKRELGSYFISPIGYVFLAVFYFFSGLYLFLGTLSYNSSSLTGVFNSLFTVSMFIVPILTMKLLSEDKKLKTDQSLLTAPVSLYGLVSAKFVAALVVFAIGLSITIIYAFILSVFVAMEWSVIIGNIVGLLVLGAALISIGLFISSLTESQVIAAVGGFAIMMFLMLLDGLASSFNNAIVTELVKYISFYNRYKGFTIGNFNISDLLFFISIAVVFNFLTARVLDKRRWS